MPANPRAQGLRTCFAAAFAIAFAAPPLHAQNSVRGEIHYVIADAARVRAAPDPGAEVVAHLRIDTPVLIIVEEEIGLQYDGWTRIAPRANPALTGYVAAGLISARRPDPELLERELRSRRAGEDLDGALTAAERLLALRPDDRMAIAELIDVLRERGERERAANVLDALTGAGPKYLAYCRAGDWSAYEGPFVLGGHAPVGPDAAPLERPASDALGWRLMEREQLAPHPLELQKMPWYVDADGVVAMPDASAWTLTPGVRYDARVVDPPRLPLSPEARAACPAPGLVRSNEAFVQVPLTSVRLPPIRERLAQDPRLGPLLDQAVRIRAARVPYADRFVSVTMEFDRRSLCRACRSLPDEIAIHALLDEVDDEIVFIRGGASDVEAPAPRLVHVLSARWGRWTSSGETFALVEWEDTTDGPGGGAFVDWMVFDADGFRNGGTFVIEEWEGRAG